MKLLPTLPPPERRQLGRFALMFAALIVSWACLHDLHLIHAEPRHFTEYHRPLLPIADLRLLALQYAVVATLGPGLIFGFLAYAACRAGRWPRLPLRPVALGFVVVLLAVELAVLWLGRLAARRFLAGGGPLYPESLYPEISLGIIYSQSVNISAYLLAPALGLAYLTVLWFWRARGMRRA